MKASPSPDKRSEYTAIVMIESGDTSIDRGGGYNDEEVDYAISEQSGSRTTSNKENDSGNQPDNTISDTIIMVTKLGGNKAYGYPSRKVPKYSCSLSVSLSDSPDMVKRFSDS